MKQFSLFATPATDCSIDIETLGTTPDCVILSIGAVFFNQSTIQGTLYLELDVQDQLDRGRIVSSDTLHWWVKQGARAQEVFHNTAKLPLLLALRELKHAYAHYPDLQRVWAKGPSFDLAILDHAYLQVHLTPPWRYKDHRDIRTLQDIAECRKIPLQLPDAPTHNALDDAKAQAEIVRQFYTGDCHVNSIASSG